MKTIEKLIAFYETTIRNIDHSFAQGMLTLDETEQLKKAETEKLIATIKYIAAAGTV